VIHVDVDAHFRAAAVGRRVGLLRGLRRLGVGLVVIVVRAWTSATSRWSRSLRIDESLLGLRDLQGGGLHALGLLGWHLKVVRDHLAALADHVRVLPGSLWLLISLLHNETAGIALVGLPDAAPDLVRRARRQLRLLCVGRTQGRIRTGVGHPIIHLSHVARRGLVELLVFLVLGLHQLPAQCLARALHLLLALIRLHGPVVLLLLLLLTLLLLKEIALRHLLLHLELLLLLGEQLGRHLGLRVQLHLELL